MQVTFKHKKINSEKLASQFATLKFTFNECHSKKLKQFSQQISFSAGNSPQICPIKIKSEFSSNQQSQKTIVQYHITFYKNQQPIQTNLPTPKTKKFNPETYQNIKITPKTSLDSPVSVANVIKWKSTQYPSNITNKMRRKLIDWMQDVVFELDFHKQVVFRAVDYVDQYISANSCLDRKYFQLIGLASLLISCKLDNVKHPNASIFLQSANNAFSAEELFDYQLKILKCLKFRLNPSNLYGQMESLFHDFMIFLDERTNLDLPKLQYKKAKREIFILLDGVLMQKQIMKSDHPLAICFSILYIYVKKQDMLYNKYRKRFNTMRKLLHQLQYIGYGNLQTKFQHFLNFSNKDIRTMDEIRLCIRQLRLWVKFQCNCKDNSSNYHPELFQFVQNLEN